MWDKIFKLYDRDQSGLADEQDVLAALQCTGRSPEQAKRDLAHASDDGRVELSRFKLLIEESISKSVKRTQGDTDNTVDQGETAKYALGILKDFEQRATVRGEFIIAAEARHYAKLWREGEEARRHDEMNSRQTREKSGIQEAHIVEAVEFNRAWSANMQEFEARAQQIMQELQQRHTDALAIHAEQQRKEVSQRMKHSKAVLDLMQVQKKLAQTGNYIEAQRCQRKIDALARQEAVEMAALVEEAVGKKLAAYQEMQRLEMEALVARIERGRSEHRNHWTQSAQRLMQAHKNMLTDLTLRQSLEVNRAAVTIKTDLRPIVRQHRPPSRQRPQSRGSSYGLPPPKVRPSRLPPSSAGSRLTYL